MKRNLSNWFYLLSPLLMGTIVGILISSSIDYQNLIKPPLAPPKIFFPIAWTIIYFLLGLSYLLLQKNDKSHPFATTVYYIQLCVNYLWSIIFFILKWRFISILWIILLDILVIMMIYLFYKKVRISAYLNIPYLLWSLFATYLTIGIYILN